jgi:hypothetical protein
VILRLDILLPLEQRLLEQLDLGLRRFCARDRGVCLGAEGRESLRSEGPSAIPARRGGTAVGGY